MALVEAKLAYLGPLIKQGLKPKQIEKRLLEDPEAPFHIAACTVGKYAVEWRKRNRVPNAVPKGFQKRHPDPPSEKEANPMAKEDDKPQTAQEKPPPGPSGSPSDTDGEWRKQFKSFCEMFPEQCQAMVSDLKKEVSQELSQIGSRVAQQVKTTMAEFGKAAPAPEPNPTAPASEEAPSEKDMLMVPPATYLQFLRGHLEVCPTCQGLGDQLIVPLKGCLEALGFNPEKEVEHARPDQGGTEPEKRAEENPGGASGGESTDEVGDGGEERPEEPKPEGTAPENSRTTDPGEGGEASTSEPSSPEPGSPEPGSAEPGSPEPGPSDGAKEYKPW